MTLLDHFSAVSQAMDGTGGLQKKENEHPDTKPAAVKKNSISFNLARTWFKERVSFDQEANVLLSFSTGLFSVGEGSADKINRDNVKPVLE